MNEKIKVLYIAGSGRSGSTLLDNILGQSPYAFSVGELYQVWNAGILKNRQCGCGQTFEQCEVWQTIFAEGFGSLDSVNAQEMVNYRDRLIRTKNIPLIKFGRIKRHVPEVYMNELQKLYQSIHQTTGCHLIVDSSKHPVYAHTLDLLPSVQVYILHLVRDPRAVAYSWKRPKSMKLSVDEDKQFTIKGARETAVAWTSWNLAIQWLWAGNTQNYLRIRYEDLVKQPETTLGIISDFVEENLAIPLNVEDEINMEKVHAILGNPVKFDTGKIILKEDLAWRSKLKLRDKLLVSFLTWPLMLRYGYA